MFPKLLLHHVGGKARNDEVPAAAAVRFFSFLEVRRLTLKTIKFGPFRVGSPRACGVPCSWSQEALGSAMAVVGIDNIQHVPCISLFVPGEGEKVVEILHKFWIELERVLRRSNPCSNWTQPKCFLGFLPAVKNFLE
jgi:hypothetical protein